MGLLVTLLVGVIVLAVVIWIVGLLPMDAKAKQIIQVVLALVVLLWLVGVLTGHAPAVVAG